MHDRLTISEKTKDLCELEDLEQEMTRWQNLNLGHWRQMVDYTVIEVRRGNRCHPTKSLGRLIDRGRMANLQKLTSHGEQATYQACVHQLESETKGLNNSTVRHSIVIDFAIGLF
jgi:hypothetical protein